MKEQCKVGKGKNHSYSITQVSEKNRARLEFESSEEFCERLSIRHRIEEKNGELKTHGLRRADWVICHAITNVFHSICSKCEENYKAHGICGRLNTCFLFV